MCPQSTPSFFPLFFSVFYYYYLLFFVVVRCDARFYPPMAVNGFPCIGGPRSLAGLVTVSTKRMLADGVSLLGKVHYFVISTTIRPLQVLERDKAEKGPTCTAPCLNPNPLYLDVSRPARSALKTGLARCMPICPPSNGQCPVVWAL